MSEIAEVRSTQKSLEEKFTPLQELVVNQLEAVNAQIEAAGSGKDTLAKLADEFRTFRVLMYSVLGTMRRQLTECSQQIDDLATRSRRKALIIHGVPHHLSRFRTDWGRPVRITTGLFWSGLPVWISNSQSGGPKPD